MTRPDRVAHPSVIGGVDQVARFQPKFIAG
jgi:hypothetical protein